MRVVFVGSGPFGEVSLARLAEEPRFRPLTVLTRPDRQRGRGRRLEPGAVAARARSLGLPLLQPPDVNHPSCRATLARICPDVVVLVSFGQKIAGELLLAAPLGWINVHASLLPRHRGPSPIQAAILEGDIVTGVSIQHVTPVIDAGDILAQMEIPLAGTETAGELGRTLARLGGDLLVETLRRMETGPLCGRPQDPARVTRTRRWAKSDGEVDWSQPADHLARLVRALNPWPSAYTFLPGAGPRRLAIHAARPLDASGEEGAVIRADAGGFWVACGRGALALEVVQLEGGRRLGSTEFLRGHRIEAGDRLGRADGD